MKRIAMALVVLSSAANAQTRPFDFTVPFPQDQLQAYLVSSGGWGDARGIEQSAEVDIPVGSRVVAMASAGSAYQGPREWSGAGQLEMMVDAFRFSGWHLAVSGGVRRHYDASDIALGRVSLSKTTDTWSFAANADFTRAFTSGQYIPSGWQQRAVSVAGDAKVTSWLRLGGESLLTDASASDVSKTIFLGPMAAFALPGHRAILTVSGGPVVRVAGNPDLLPDFTVVGKYMMPFPADQSGYTVRLAVSVPLF